MTRISGTITVVQEGRFRLATGDGQSILFALASDATLEPQDLQPFVSGPRVDVVFSTQRGRKAMTAHSIDRAVP
jgi:hypothetical protein